MEWQIHIPEDGSRLTVRAWGPAEIQGFVTYLQVALAHPAWRPGIPALLDFRDLDTTPLRASDLQQLASLFRPHAEALARGRIALLVARPVDFGIVRMWEAFVADQHLPQSVFYSLEEAEAWLLGS